MTSENRQHTQVADALVRAERERAPMPPLSRSWPGLGLDDAYEIQLYNAARRLAAGDERRGHKVGLTSAAMQRQLGVDQPDFGQLFATMEVPDGGQVDLGTLIAPRVEIEVAFVLSRPLAGPDVDVADVLAVTDHVRPAIEIIDSRIADWQIALVDTIADNASSAGYVLGEPAADHGGAVDALDLASMTGRLLVNGQEIAAGTGAEVLGHPAAAVAWLANTLDRRRIALDAGQVVLPGACTRAVPVARGDVVMASFDGLGDVTVSFR
ncbi:MAG: 2-keto-4-pentenoate hydratase [bacterium]